MKLYDDEGNLDLETARAELAGAIGQHNDIVHRKTVGAITAAALLDIAASLRPVGVESSIALEEAYGDAPALDDLSEPADMPPVAPEDAYAEAKVRLAVPDNDGNYRTGTLAGNDGIDQGAAWVGVFWDDELVADGPTKVYAENLVVIEDDEPVEDITEEEAMERKRLADNAKLADDSTVDDDFDNALEVLEAKTAPKKKKAKK